MNFKAITIEECEQLYFFKGFTTVIDNGEVIGFEKSIENKHNPNFISKFVFCAKPKCKCSIF